MCYAAYNKFNTRKDLYLSKYNRPKDYEVMMKSYMDFKKKQAKEHNTNNLALAYPQFAGAIEDDPSLSNEHLSEIAEAFQRVNRRPTTRTAHDHMNNMNPAEHDSLYDDHNHYE